MSSVVQISRVRISAAAMPLIDRDQDGRATAVELAEAFRRDRVAFDATGLIDPVIPATGAANYRRMAHSMLRTTALLSGPVYDERGEIVHRPRSEAYVISAERLRSFGETNLHALYRIAAGVDTQSPIGLLVQSTLQRANGMPLGGADEHDRWDNLKAYATFTERTLRVVSAAPDAQFSH